MWLRSGADKRGDYSRCVADDDRIYDPSYVAADDRGYAWIRRKVCGCGMVMLMGVMICSVGLDALS